MTEGIGSMLLRRIVEIIMLFIIAVYNYHLPIDLMPDSPLDNALISVVAAFTYYLLVKKDIQDLSSKWKKRIIPYEIFLFMTVLCMVLTYDQLMYPKPDITFQELSNIRLCSKLIVIQSCVVYFLVLHILKRAKRNKDCVTQS